MKKLILIILASLSFGGCTASMVQMRDDSNKSAYAPLNEKKGGTVKYQAGWNISQGSDRERCYRKMYEACGGNYIITREYDQSAHSNTVGWAPQFATTGHIIYKYLDFECVKEN